MKRLRLLIYDGPPDRIQFQREHDGVRGSEPKEYGRDGLTIRSIELDPRRITIVELVRLFLREDRTR